MEGNHPIKFNSLVAHEKLIHQNKHQKNLQTKKIKALRSSLINRQKLHTNNIVILILLNIVFIIPKYDFRHGSKDDFYQESSYEVSKANLQQGNADANKGKDQSFCNLVCMMNFLQMERYWGQKQVFCHCCCVEHRIFSNPASNLMIQ